MPAPRSSLSCGCRGIRPSGSYPPRPFAFHWRDDGNHDAGNGKANRIGGLTRLRSPSLAGCTSTSSQRGVLQASALFGNCRPCSLEARRVRPRLRRGMMLSARGLSPTGGPTRPATNKRAGVVTFRRVLKSPGDVRATREALTRPRRQRRAALSARSVTLGIHRAPRDFDLWHRRRGGRCQ